MKKLNDARDDYNECMRRNVLLEDRMVRWRRRSDELSDILFALQQHADATDERCEQYKDQVDQLQLLLLEKEEVIENKEKFITELVRNIGDLNDTLDNIMKSDRAVRYGEFQQLANFQYTEELERCLHLALRPEVDPTYFREQCRRRYQAIRNLDYIPIDPRMRSNL